jgi:protein-disulfide isomerase-like protein with CxxC motif
MNLPEITDLQRLNLQPGDRLVVRFHGRLTAAQAHMIRERLREWSGGGFPVLVLDADASLEVVTADGHVREIAR